MALTEGVVALLLSTPISLSLATCALLFFVGRALESSIDDLEPPVLRSKIPIFGHFYSLLKDQEVFFKHLYKKYHLPIATVPILRTKLYAISDPILAQSAYCNKHLSFTPFAVGGAQKVAGFSDEYHQVLMQTNVLPEYFKSLYDGTTAQHIHQLNVTSLKHVASHFNSIGGDGMDVANTYLWLRNLMTVATCEGLYGPENPIRSDELVEDVWTFETGLPYLFLHFFNSTTLQRTKEARQRIQQALGKWCKAMKQDDEQVSAYIRNRVGVLRSYGVEEEQLGVIECGLIHVPTSNSIPTIFWFFMHVFTRPELVLRMRAELEPIAHRGPGHAVTINIDDILERCPLLISAYREASRICNGFTCNRLALEDTTITDGQGRPYLLKKGAAVKIPTGVIHSSEDIWGEDALTFRADRFLDKGLTNEQAKIRRAAWTPFGGGAHMCPGRNFATAEIYGFVAALVLGYHVEPLDGNWHAYKPPPMASCPQATSVRKPADEAAVCGTRLTRRSGWEAAQWNFISGPVTE
ncbi:25-hydroxycholesterol 7-alpha-hydroxylase-like protein [Emericellopsis cladophorae]|uniref:25-hydroxycholesterol 7-alpha-hydroxylase-like protein n=1 Tax=Emericellopsis cladophorae TaxID=2686198 RepID=A0A9P9XVJ1_9HYPO|nr:25-hydroxycholesterol 7-alpha-hydroxylase-like protein [Emericellopsis cladophorae]KAI6778540.1 25-hydroxycholesterol 7-alpha-hydroxylase-like protein [Emericellopsis cladophorae]